MFLNGKKDAILRQIQLVDIHGTRFYDIVFTHSDTPDQARRARIGVEDAYSDPAPGDPVSVSYVMNVVTGLTRR